MYYSHIPHNNVLVNRQDIQWWSHTILMEMKKFPSPRDILAFVAQFLLCGDTGVTYCKPTTALPVV